MENCIAPGEIWELSSRFDLLCWSLGSETWCVAHSDASHNNQSFYYNDCTRERTWECPVTKADGKRRLVVIDLSLFIDRTKYKPGVERKRLVRDNDTGASFRAFVRQLNELGYELCPDREALVFSWTQREAERTEFKMVSGKPIFLKSAEKVHECFPAYQLEDIIILDDEVDKLQNNKLGNGLVVSPEDVRGLHFFSLMGELSKVRHLPSAFSGLQSHPFINPLTRCEGISTTNIGANLYCGKLGLPARRDASTPKAVWNKSNAREWFDYISQARNSTEALSRLALMAALVSPTVIIVKTAWAEQSSFGQNARRHGSGSSG